MKDYGLRFCETSQDLTIPQVLFSVEFAAGSVLSGMGSSTQSNPEVSMWVMDVGILI